MATLALAVNPNLSKVPWHPVNDFEGVAHMVNLERPVEFNKLVGDFLDAAGRPTLTKPFDFDEVLRVIQGALRAVETP